MGSRSIVGVNLSRWASAWIFSQLPEKSPKLEVSVVDPILIQELNRMNADGFSIENERKFLVYSRPVLRVTPSLVELYPKMSKACDNVYSGASGLPPKSPREVAAMAIHYGFSDTWDLVAWSSIISGKVSSPNRYKTLGTFAHSVMTDMNSVVGIDMPSVDLGSALQRRPDDFWYFSWILHAKTLGVYRRRQVESAISAD